MTPTRRVELEEQARQIICIIHEKDSHEPSMGEIGLVLELLLRIERETWEKAEQHYRKVAFLYGNDSWRERSCMEEAANWCKDQQAEVDIERKGQAKGAS